MSTRLFCRVGDLHCSYRVFCRSWRTPGAELGWFEGACTLGWFEGACTLGWEVLIIRFPEIATRWRSRLLDLPDDEEAWNALSPSETAGSTAP